MQMIRSLSIAGILCLASAVPDHVSELHAAGELELRVTDHTTGELLPDQRSEAPLQEAGAIVRAEVMSSDALSAIS